MADKPKKFVIYGKVIEKETNKGISGLIVEALDKDLVSDDRLGTVTTNKDGIFEIRYDRKDFQELFVDRKPDIFLRIKDSKGTVITTTEDKVRYGATKTETFNISISGKLLDADIGSERMQFKQLIAKNPNYFGNIVDKTIIDKFKPVLKMQSNTNYEELKCVGLYPEDDLLEAVLEIKSPTGYGGSLCFEGNKEYVAFYIDYNDGAGFVSVGAPAEVAVHDIAFVNGGHIFYAVRKPFVPKQYLKCDTPQIVKVRAILSYQAIPTGPNYVPVYGNVVDVWVQIKPKWIGPFVRPIGFAYELQPIKIDPDELLIQLPEKEVEPPIGPIPPVEKYIIWGDKKEIKELVDRSIAAEKRIKEEGKVEKERFEFKKLVAKNPNYFGSITESKDKKEILKAVYAMPSKTKELLLPQIEIDTDMLIPITPVLLKTAYEELKCVGLYPEGDLLEAVIEIKKPTGFCGDLCTLGSREYVAFYIDWGNGVYKHVATTSVGVHDIPEVNDKHLFYAVRSLIPDIKDKLKACTKENIVKVKAIMSWNVDPTPFGHTYTPVWGNVLVRNIQIRPKNGASAKCNIEIVNEIHVDDISHSGPDEGLAIKVTEAGTVPGTHDRPFGGIIACWGNINIFNAMNYRFLYSADGGVSWTPVKDKRRARNALGFTILRTPDSNGWFSKAEFDADELNYSLTALVHWRSHGKNDDYILKLQITDATKLPILGEFKVPIKLDNTGIELLDFSGTPTPLPAKGVVVKDSLGAYRKCGTFEGDEEIRIFGNFWDDYFRAFRLKVFGGNINASGVQIGSGRYHDSKIFDRLGSEIPALSGNIGYNGITGAASGASGPGQQIGTLNLCTIEQVPSKVRCAYGIELTLWDRAIVGYVSGYQFNTTSHKKDAFVTFDWDPKGCPP